MFEITWKDSQGQDCSELTETLAMALEFAKELGILVTINGSGMEIVGVFGADSVQQGKLPNGTEYNWYKRRIPQ